MNQVKTKDVRTLRPAEVAAILKEVGVPDDNIKYLYMENINGEVLLTLTEDDLCSFFHMSRLGKNSSIALDKILFLIQDMKNNKYKYSGKKIQAAKHTQTPKLSPEKAMEAIVKKLKSSTKLATQLSAQQLNEYAENLSIPDKMKNAYLNKEFDAIKKMFANMAKDDAAQSAVTAKKEEDIEFNIEEIDREEQKNKDNEFSKIKDKIKVKLVIAEIAKTSREKTVRKVLSPIISTFNMNPTFGFFHSALIIGPWYIEWNSSSLVVPRRCYSNAAIVAIDIPSQLELLGVDTVVDRLSEVIAEWNIHKSYNQTKANCQHFVDAVCDALDIKFNFKGTIADYLNKLRTKGKCKVQWNVPDEIRTTFDVKEKKKVFASHRELDEFMVRLNEVGLLKDTFFKESHQEDYELLKAFDRAFWLRHFRSNVQEDYLPLCEQGDENEVKCLCPFGDPTVSHSLAKDWW